MEKTFLKRITAFSAALTVIAGAAVSCSKKDNASEGGKTKDAAQLMAGAYKTEQIDCDIVNPTSIARISDDKIVITGYDEEKNAPTLYLTDNGFSEFNEVKMEIPEAEGDVEVRYDNCVAPDGEIMVFATFTDYGDGEKPDFDSPDFNPDEFDFEEYYSNVSYSYKLYVVDIDGKVKSSADVTGLEEFQDDESGSLNIGRASAIGGGKMIATAWGEMEDYNIIINSDGKVDGELDLGNSNYIDSFTAIDDDTIAVCGYFGGKEYVKYLDAGTLKETGEQIDLSEAGLEGQMGSVFKGTGDYKLYINGSSGLFGITEDGKSTEIVNWLDSDLGDGGIQSLLILDDGDFVVCYNDYSGGDYGNSGSTLYKLTKRDASEMENTKVITVGVLYDDWAVKEKISAYNKKNDDVRFKMVDYSKYDNYEEETGKTLSSGADQLKKDIVSGNAPDMIVSYNGAIISSLYNKGLFVDLYEYMDKDSDINKDDIMPNVLNACEIDGKLLSIAPSFNVSTMIAKKKFIDKENWSPDDLIEAYENLPDGMRLTALDCKEQMLSFMMGVLNNCIDYQKGTCNFDTPETRKLLAFVDQFPSSEDLVDWEDQSAMQEMFSEDNFKEDKVLVQELYISDFREYTREIKGRYKGDDIVFVGNPTTDGRGAVLTLDKHFAILSNAEDKEVCWNFIKEFLLPAEDGEESMYSYGFPSLKSEFDKLADESMEKPKYKDENGKEVEEDLTYYTSSKEIKVDPLTKEERDFIVDYIESADNVSADFDPEVESILEEEIMAYIGGEKTADEVIDLIQSRVSILVSEQS